jgi:UDP:flavonoid glycosyltransferase YjiC (YdhE family)
MTASSMDASAVVQKRPLRWAFFAHAYNLGDLSRAIEVAKAMKATGAEVRFYHRGGTYVDQLAAAGLQPIPLEPFITESEDAALMDLDQHRAKLGTPFPYSEAKLTAMVESELLALREFQPDGVYCGLNLTCKISVPRLKLPSVALVPTALCPAFCRAGLASFPDAMNTPLLRFLVPGWVKRTIINRVMLGDVAKRTAAVFNRVAARYGAPPIYNLTELVRCELTLLPDHPALSGLPASQLPVGYRYSGPLFARMGLPIPDEVRQVFGRPGLKVYCAMGSSVPAELLKRVVSLLRSVPEYNVVCATTRLLDPAELGPQSDNFYAARYLPALEVNGLADIAVTHGGQGTVQTAVFSGTPIVGIAMQWEQQANLDALARAGAAMRLPLYGVTRESLLGAVETMRATSCRENMERLSRQVRSLNGAEEAVRQMNDWLRERRRGTP